MTNCDMEAKMMMNPQMSEQIRRIIVSGPIIDMTAAMFLDQITMFEYMDISAPINVYINSPGGCVDAALGMLDAMTTCACPVKTIGIGSVCSAAVLLLAAGEKNNRVIAPSCRVMIHQVSSGVGGTTSELDNEIQEVRRLQDIYNELLVKYTGQKMSKIKADMAQNYYMGAEEAIRYGICDRIIPTRKMGKLIIPGPKAKQFRVKKAKPAKGK